MKQAIQSHGPYGSKLFETYRWHLGDGERITKVIIRHDYIVDAIGFVIAKSNESDTSPWSFGGDGGKKDEIELQEGEYMTRISGKYGYDRGRNQEEIVSLKIHTNLCLKGYGPYGKGFEVETAYDFSSPILFDCQIVGFFGRHNNVLESIGILLEKVHAIEPYGRDGSTLPINDDRLLLEDGERILELIIRHGNIVDAIGFKIVKRDGKITSKKFGGKGGKESKIFLQDGEHVTRISAEYGYDEGRNQEVIVSLRIHTNLCIMGYGPYGEGSNIKTTHSFSSPILIDRHIVGFFARHNNFLQSIGVLLEKDQSIESHGPYGSNFRENYIFLLGEGERITKVQIRYGYVVDAISFEIAKRDGQRYSTQLFGGDGGDFNQIELQDGEYITRISGKYGYNGNRNQENIAFLKIYTNLCSKGYGEYGEGRDFEFAYEFSSPVSVDNHIVGFYGRCNKFLESIGILTRKKQETERYGPYGSQLPPNYRLVVEDSEVIREVTITYEDDVNPIGFVIDKKSKDKTLMINFSGNGGKECEKFVLKDGEYLTKISGKYDEEKCNVATLMLHTNICPKGYGPFGRQRDVDSLHSFSSPLISNSSIVGIFGRYNTCELESIGVIIKKWKLIESYGSYGSKLPNNFCLQLEDGERISKIRLTHGLTVNSIGFEIAKPGKKVNHANFGGCGEPQNEVLNSRADPDFFRDLREIITLKNDEYLIRISGTYGYDRSRKQDVIACLKIHTNLRPTGYGPYGQGLHDETAYEFTSPHLTNGPIVGVFGRSTNRLESIGVLSKKGRVIDSYGPYGSDLEQNYCMKVNDGERITEVRIRRGNAINAIVFVIENSREYSTSNGKIDGVEQKIILSDDEYLTRISGTYQNHGIECVIATLKIHTNLCCKAFGDVGGCVDNVHEFSSPILNDGPIVGIFGRSNDTHVESIGVLLKREFEFTNHTYEEEHESSS